MQSIASSTGSSLGTAQVHTVLHKIWRALTALGYSSIGLALAVISAVFYIHLAKMLPEQQIADLVKPYTTIGAAIIFLHETVKNLGNDCKQLWPWLKLKTDEFAEWKFSLAIGGAFLSLILGYVGGINIAYPDRDSDLSLSNNDSTVVVEPVVKKPGDGAVEESTVEKGELIISDVTPSSLSAVDQLPLVRFAPGRLISQPGNPQLDFNTDAVTLNSRQQNAVRRYWNQLTSLCITGTHLEGSVAVNGYASDDPVSDIHGRQLPNSDAPNLALANKRASGLAEALKLAAKMSEAGGKSRGVKIDPLDWQSPTDMRTARDGLLGEAGTGNSQVHDFRSAVITPDLFCVRNSTK